MAKSFIDVSELIGVPFKFGGRGPHEFDCYGLVRELYRRLHGIEIPDYTSPTDQAVIGALMANQLTLWEQIPYAPGGVLLFRVMGYGAHVGFALPHERFVHTWEASNGVTIETLRPTWERRVVGCYRYVGN